MSSISVDALQTEVAALAGGSKCLKRRRCPPTCHLAIENAAVYSNGRNADAA